MEGIPEQEQLFEVRCASVETKAEIQKLRYKLKRHSRHVATDNCKIAFFSKHVVLVLFALAGNASVATEYLHKYKQRYHHATVARHDLIAVVEQWVIDLPQASYDILLLPVSESEVKAVQVARKFFAEHSTAMWIERNNEQKGVAPGTFSVMSKFDHELVGAQRVLNDMDYDLRQDVRLPRHRSFAFRFRKRWQISLHSLKDRGDIPMETKRAKVIFFSKKRSFLAIFWALKPSPRGSPRT